ncbi:UNVERIFIED_CONTAM: hypothetical protein Slati_4203600 [Sesamum latifolium]|uniref:Uncharacterized protein n=1 Tax=Sesamum latifolium TaxID=2727402 RepID=A0AAW2TBU2_9LAMI
MEQGSGAKGVQGQDLNLGSKQAGKGLVSDETIHAGEGDEGQEEMQVAGQENDYEGVLQGLDHKECVPSTLQGPIQDVGMQGENAGIQDKDGMELSLVNVPFSFVERGRPEHRLRGRRGRQGTMRSYMEGPEVLPLHKYY